MVFRPIQGVGYSSVQKTGWGIHLNESKQLNKMQLFKAANLRNSSTICFMDSFQQSQPRDARDNDALSHLV